MEEESQLGESLDKMAVHFNGAGFYLNHLFILFEQKI